MGVDHLGLDVETMRRLGYQTVDWLVERLAVSGEEPTMVRASPAEMAERIGSRPPRRGEPIEVILDQLGEQVLPYRSRCDHPRYLAFVPGSGTWPGALGDLIASAYNIDVGSWVESAGPSHLELVLLRWFADTIGFPPTAMGVLVSGGSAANMTALACAREALVGAMSTDVVVYVSDQAHSSVARAARMLGFRSDQVRVLPVDGGYRMRVEALRDAMDADVGAGRRPLVVVAAAGSTNTGAVDEFARIADVCRPRGVWLHVDGAYGGFAALTDRGRMRLEGLELADSVTLDPHKWLYQPFECGALLVHEGHRLREAFAIHPDYLQDVAAAQQETNFADQGLQLTRMSRALKLWVSLSYFGTDAFVAAIDRAMDLAELAQQYIENSPVFELLVPATLGIVCFRRRLPGTDDEGLTEAANAGLVAGLADSGEGMISSTRLRGRYAMRLCVLNHTTTSSDVERVLGWLETADVGAGDEGASGPNPRAAALDGGWLRPPAESLTELRQIPLFDGLDESQLMWVRSSGRTRRVNSGESVVRQWEVDRDFYVILEGTAEVFAADRQLTGLGHGDFFGELAALDWGASFGYPRLATVRATAPLRMLVLSDVQLAELMRTAPSVATRIRSTAAERLARG
jgi:glutamate/tyrosine decarboxylase-like PLP-dependent enzyme